MDNCSHVSIFLSLIARKLLSLQDLVAVLPNGSAWLNASFGLVIALMTLKLWELAGLFLPMLVILLAQVVLVAVVALVVVFRFLGRDYEAAVMSAGYCGFALGTTANAMANMKAIVERYGRAPRAFLVVPMVGAFFIDFTNALIITIFLNLFK